MWPIFLKKPFFIFGGYGSLDALKNYGFKTFDKIFDESYQYELDITTKSEMIVNQLLELSTMPEWKLKNIIDSVRDIVEYNHNLLVSNAKNRSSLTLLYVHDNIERIKIW
jgi:hypothetical protein